MKRQLYRIMVRHKTSQFVFYVEMLVQNRAMAYERLDDYDLIYLERPSWIREVETEQFFN